MNDTNWSEALRITMNDEPIFVLGSTLINTCSSCSKERESYFQYGGTKLTRTICKDCFTAILDKAFAVKIDVEMENLLFRK